MRHFFIGFSLVAIFCGSIVAGISLSRSVDSTLPTVVTSTLQQAAATGNADAVTAAAKQMTDMFPAYEAEIADYTANIAIPATNVAAVATDMTREKDAFDLETAAGPNADTQAIDAMASDLNNLDIGSPEAASAN